MAKETWKVAERIAERIHLAHWAFHVFGGSTLVTLSYGVVERLSGSQVNWFGLGVLFLVCVVLFLGAVVTARNTSSGASSLVPVIAQGPVSPEPDFARLVIYNAFYHAIDGTGDDCDVTECLQKLSASGSLVLQIENHSFVADGHNYVPRDPRFNVKKKLEVEYSYGSRKKIKTERLEGFRLVLPEDTWQLAEIQRVTAFARGEEQLLEEQLRLRDDLISQVNQAKQELREKLPPQNVLREKCLSLGRELLQSLPKEGSGNPLLHLRVKESHLQGDKDVLDAAKADFDAAFEVRTQIHNEFMFKFSQRTRDLLYELAANKKDEHRFGVDLSVDPEYIDPKAGLKGEVEVRRIASYLFLVATRIDMDDAIRKR